MAEKESMPRVNLAEGRLREEKTPLVRRVPAYIPQFQESSYPYSEAASHASAQPPSLPHSAVQPPSSTRKRWISWKGMQVRRLPQTPGKPLSWQSKLGMQAAICVAILAIVWALQAIDTPATQTMVEGVRNAVTFEVNLDESIGRLKLVQEFLPNVSAVFMPTTALVAPVNALVQAYEKDGVYQAADFAAQAGAVVTAAGPGEVLETGVSSAGIGYIRLRHSDGSEGRYENLTDITVLAGDRVERGTQLGVVADNGKVMRFTWLVDGKAADPGFVK